MCIRDRDRGAQEIFKALPYVVTIVVLVITSLRKKREYPVSYTHLDVYKRQDQRRGS